MDYYLDCPVPLKAWFTLREACVLKGVNYKTCLNKKWIQPNGGVGAKVGGRKVFSHEQVLEWLNKTDDDLQGELS